MGSESTKPAPVVVQDQFEAADRVPTRVLIVNGCPATRAGIRSWLDSADDLQVTAEAGAAAHAVELASALGPDVALVQFQLPDELGPIACRQILAASPETSVLLMDDLQPDAHLAAASDAGASGLLSGNAEAQEMLDALRQVAAGREVFTRVQRIRIHAWQEEIGCRLQSLSQREHEVLSHILGGETNREIAATLVISENTVEKHVGTVLSKLGVESRRALLVLAMREHFQF